MCTPKPLIVFITKRRLRHQFAGSRVLKASGKGPRIIKKLRTIDLDLWSKQLQNVKFSCFIFILY